MTSATAWLAAIGERDAVTTIGSKRVTSLAATGAAFAMANAARDKDRDEGTSTARQEREPVRKRMDFIVEISRQNARPSFPAGVRRRCKRELAPRCWPVSGLAEQLMRPSQKPKLPVVRCKSRGGRHLVRLPLRGQRRLDEFRWNRSSCFPFNSVANDAATRHQREKC
ncbi:hypothetical protein SDC9_184242 [bioreactor metagenome]|uniref:Uncharacterized protein n=1 Tax=bioreactor metagenome TaxID=1076179 RepID=A0A645HED8_9ZZZZ